MPSRSRSGNPFVRSIVLVQAVARKHRFRVALIGGFALPFHGVQRATGDVDFLVEASGADAQHDALLAAGGRCLHRSTDAANYAPGASGLSPLDFIFAHRERAQAMLRRARPRLLRGARLRVPVVGTTTGSSTARAISTGCSASPRSASVVPVTPGDASIVGAEVADQTHLRGRERVTTLDQFLEFLSQLEAVFGPLARPREPSTGNRFLL